MNNDLVQALDTKLSETSPSSDIKSVYLTLLALYILEEGFAEEEDQW